ncbi:stalk domain-containing protein [Paenibacillus radicis (ex Xue et al. 2023)]|uniref:Stalk domain-containing protein n=1 Tax=Paenibacillus radicis (ex Xue et al. 2023) TaxID=2972489 RepID=A0ABT1YE20_9BACL|nr:stalk domain-containing protein [Paenibacillus radicis (ex Xue et al. 2023)]MCR8631433.1 stalk domain-containing protein [Paenibacillus radicis (ex Xue et al. 2023)]
MAFFKRLTSNCMKGLLVVTVAAGLLAGAPAVQADAIWDQWKAAESAVKRGKPEEAVPHWKFLVEHYVSIGDWQSAALFCGSLDEYYDSIQDYENAIYYYELENEYWLKFGKDWGAVDIQRAEQIRTIADVYMSSPDEDTVRRQAAPKNGKLAKFEPEYGMYIGLYSEQDPAMQNNFTKSEALYGKKHALYLAYSPYDTAFPKQYATRAKEAGSALQIAWEPSKGLDSVQDDAHLREWARAAKASGIPIFLRYASEMNGNWVVWHGDPQKYIEKFRLVHDVMAQEAPNVAMVWSPGDVPAYSMDVYYPGDEYVDWVGVSLYTEPYENGDPAQSNMQATSPIERLDSLYKTYADRKPIMISETAVSHYAHIPQESFTDYGLLNLQRLYEIMPLKYPRLKSITYFNVDLKNRESRNNYLLGANEAMKALYSKMIAAPYYLTKVEQGAKPSDRTGHVKLSVSGENIFARKTKLTPWVKIPDIYIGKIDYSINGEIIRTETGPPFGFELDAGDVPDGASLKLEVYNRSGSKAASRTFSLSSQVSVAIDGKLQSYEQPPIIKEGSTLAPLRAIFESVGAAVSWDASTQTATGRKGNTTVSLKIGDRKAVKNGQTIELEVPAQLINGFTLAPARFVGEAFGGELQWDGKSRTVQIQTTDKGKATSQMNSIPSNLSELPGTISSVEETARQILNDSPSSGNSMLTQEQKPDSLESGWLIQLKLSFNMAQRSFKAVASFIYRLLPNSFL